MVWLAHKSQWAVAGDGSLQRNVLGRGRQVLTPTMRIGVVQTGVIDKNDIPFAAADNPVMCMVAYLASVVNPSVAAAAAQAAMGALLGEKVPADSFGASKSDANGMDVDGASTSTSTTSTSLNDTKPFNADLQAAAAAALGAAAVKAKLLAQKEEHEIQRLVREVIELQVRKLEMKLSSFEKLEQDIEQELRQVWQWL
jgi:SWI/SNF related-matrix-associated actin-dependent regulator of chromatin subfamily C